MIHVASELGQTIRGRLHRPNGEGFIDFPEAMARRELRHHPSPTAWRGSTAGTAGQQCHTTAPAVRPGLPTMGVTR